MSESEVDDISREVARLTKIGVDAMNRRRSQSPAPTQRQVRRAAVKAIKSEQSLTEWHHRMARIEAEAQVRNHRFRVMHHSQPRAGETQQEWFRRQQWLDEERQRLEQHLGNHPHLSLNERGYTVLAVEYAHDNPGDTNHRIWPQKPTALTAMKARVHAGVARLRADLAGPKELPTLQRWDARHRAAETQRQITIPDPAARRLVVLPVDEDARRSQRLDQLEHDNQQLRANNDRLTDYADQDRGGNARPAASPRQTGRPVERGPVPPLAEDPFDPRSAAPTDRPLFDHRDEDCDRIAQAVAFQQRMQAVDQVRDARRDTIRGAAPGRDARERAAWSAYGRKLRGVADSIDRQLYVVDLTEAEKHRLHRARMTVPEHLMDEARAMTDEQLDARWRWYGQPIAENTDERVHPDEQREMYTDAVDEQIYGRETYDEHDDRPGEDIDMQELNPPLDLSAMRAFHDRQAGRPVERTPGWTRADQDLFAEVYDSDDPVEPGPSTGRLDLVARKRIEAYQQQVQRLESELAGLRAQNQQQPTAHRQQALAEEQQLADAHPVQQGRFRVSVSSVDQYKRAGRQAERVVDRRAREFDSAAEAYEWMHEQVSSTERNNIQVGVIDTHAGPIEKAPFAAGASPEQVLTALDEWRASGFAHWRERGLSHVNDTTGRTRQPSEQPVEDPPVEEAPPEEFDIDVPSANGHLAAVPAITLTEEDELTEDEN